MIKLGQTTLSHYSDVTMSAVASQITGNSTVSSTICLCVYQNIKTAWLALCEGKQWFSLTKGQ